MKKLIAGLLLVPCFAHAGFDTGNELFSKMNDESQARRMYALGFVLGVHDMLEGDLVCAGDNVTAGQLRDIVKKFLTENPSMRNRPAVILSGIAMAQAFPCAKQKGKQS